MSLADEARTIRERITDRLDELEPLVREYDELRLAAAELGIDADGPDRPPLSQTSAGRSENSERRTARRRSSPRRGQVPRPAPSAPDDSAVLVLEAIRSDPGKTVAEYAVILDRPPASLYGPVRQLANDGTVVKRARKLFPR